MCETIILISSTKKNRVRNYDGDDEGKREQKGSCDIKINKIVV